MELLAQLLLANIAILAAVILMQPLWRDIRHGLAYTLGNFDERRPETVLERRLSMVVRNQVEALALLSPAVLVLIGLGSSTLTQTLVYAAYAHAAARLAYAAASLAGIPVLRSLFWTASFGAWAVIAVEAAKLVWR